MESALENLRRNTINDSAKLYKMAYLQSGKQVFKVHCMICRKQADQDRMLLIYMDVSNSGFHCAAHSESFHLLVSQKWNCCDLDPQER